LLEAGATNCALRRCSVKRQLGSQGKKNTDATLSQLAEVYLTSSCRRSNLKNKPEKIKSKPKSLRAVQPSKARADKANWGGPRKGSGRKKGSTNVFSREIKESVIRAASRIGRDGKGTGGMDGYMERLALNNEPVFGGLLRGVMGTQVSVDHHEAPPTNEAEFRRYIERLGLNPRLLDDLPGIEYHTPEEVLELTAQDVTDTTDHDGD
jgi:hypothetical protein